MTALYRPNESRASIPLNTPPAHEQVVEGEVLNKQAQPEFLYRTTTSVSSDDKMNSYLQYAQNNVQEVSVGYYIDYFA